MFTAVGGEHVQSGVACRLRGNLAGRVATAGVALPCLRRGVNVAAYQSRRSVSVANA
jgi:hypothetical protein